MIPELYHINALRKLRGDAQVTYPDADSTIRRIERVFSVDRGTPPSAYNTLKDLEYATAELVEQYQVGGDAQQVEFYQAFMDLPGKEVVTLSIADNGALQTTTVQKVQPGTVTPTGGLLVVSDQVAPAPGAVSFDVHTRTVVAEQPLLSGVSVDEATGIKTAYTKQIVAAGTTSAEPYAEIQPVNKFKSILIISEVDVSTLPEAKTWLATTRHSFPDILTDLDILGVANDGREELAMTYELHEGYSGPCNARFTEHYFTSTQYAAYTAPAVTKFAPRSTQFFFYDPTVVRIWQFRTPRSLHAAFTPSVFGITPIPSGGIPATTPTGYSSGDWIYVDIQPEKWRFGVWKVTEIEVQIP